MYATDNRDLLVPDGQQDRPAQRPSSGFKGFFIM